MDCIDVLPYYEQQLISGFNDTEIDVSRDKSIIDLFEQQVEKQLHDFISLRPSKTPGRPNVFRRKKRMNTLNTMLLAGSILWLCLNVYIVSPSKVNFASLNPFTAARETTISESSKPQIYTQPSVARAETVYVKTTEPISPETTVVPPSQQLLEAISSKEDTHHYFIVAAAFKSMANAKNKASELKAQGFPNADVVENGQGFKLVCYEGFTTYDSALNELPRMKEVNRESWIFSK